MIEVRPPKSDMFSDPADAYVNPVNTVGIMGKGLAREFKHRFPNASRQYITEATAGRMQPGRVLVTQDQPDQLPYILHFPTKQHWRHRSHIVLILSGMDALSQILYNFPIRSINIPALGCGLGGLTWPQVERIIRTSLARHPAVHARLYPPY